MGLFRDSRDRRDLSLKVCWTLAVWLMTQQLRCDVNEADEAEQRRLEHSPVIIASFSKLPTTTSSTHEDQRSEVWNHAIWRLSTTPCAAWKIHR